MADVSNAAKNVGLQVSESLCAILWGYMARSGIAGLQHNSIFNFLGNHYTVFKNASFNYVSPLKL